MAKPYAQEMSRLSETLAWVSGAEIDALCQAVAAAGVGPLVAVGSGGSLSAAHAHVFLHQQFTNQLAAVATPLEAASDRLQSNVSTWLLSAGGSNVDIVACFRALVKTEARQLAVLCGRTDSPLAALARDHPFVDLMVHAPPAGRDGFLATNSLFAFVGLLTRAYSHVFGRYDQGWDNIYNLVAPMTELGGTHQSDWKAASDPLWDRQTTVVLYGAATRVGAIDLESKFTEAALGNVQLADWRNFAHGRHHWLAKRGGSTAVLALIAPDDQALAERTLALIPDHIPVGRLRFSGPSIANSLGSLASALCIAGWAGAAKGIDPGRPGVPEFGRRLYHLPLPRPSRAVTGLTERDAAAITRKAGVGIETLARRGDLNAWRSAHRKFKNRLASGRFAGVVLDYDGTVVDPRRRFSKPEPQIVSHLIRLCEARVRLAIATGRGASVRRDLQAVLPAEFWPHVTVGYYNGGDIASLDDDHAPCRDGPLCASLAPIAEALRLQPELAWAARQTDRPCQITLEPKWALPEARLWDLAQQVITSAGAEDVAVTRSSHSVDIVPKLTTKRAVLDRLRAQSAAAEFLTIGDRGRWPGNDYLLLREPYALSVDEVSVDPTTCWNLGSPGQRGVQVLLEYLQQITAADGEAEWTGRSHG
jgi:fructoselysine-6-P-deglycase FrlB-like protein